ncbi:MAG TPA: Dam family site-specific DNA-(adenine-N6)-methyltransferase [Nitrososphaera sp.]|nr:Dam family site-specific DNA-(adenine-N6)-methyltransferase [Nitrososphaera sp.]
MQYFEPPEQRDAVSAAPFLKWAGGKTQLLFELAKHVPVFTRYFEQFLGSGAFFFYLASRGMAFNAYLSDANSELVNAYSVVKHDLHELIVLLGKHESGYKKSPRNYYYKLRNTRPSGRVEKAARFIALNKTCFNGLYRVNSRGLFNVPIGRYKNPTICNIDRLESASAALNNRHARLRSSDYRTAVCNVWEGDFVYIDPPFVPLSATANFVSYTQQGFTENDQRELARVFKDLDRKKCKVLLSNSDTQLTRELYREFHQKAVPVARAISCKVSSRSGISELLVQNYSV